MRTCRATARAIKMTEDPIARMLPALSVGHVAGDMPQRPLGHRYAMTWRALFPRLRRQCRRVRCSTLGPVPAPCRKGWTVSAAVRPRLAIRRVSPPFLRYAPCRSEEHTSELQSLMRISYAVFCLKQNITRAHAHSTSPQEKI